MSVLNAGETCADSRGTAHFRALVCGLAFVVSTGCQQTPEPVDPITPLTLDVASCAGLDPLAADGSRMERAPFPIPDPDGLLVQLETLERQLADATDAYVPELLFTLGRLRTAFRIRDDSPHAGYAASRPEQFLKNIYRLWTYQGADFRELIRRYPGSEWVDAAAYALTLLPVSSDCEGSIACEIGVEWRPVATFLRAYPDSPFAAAAIDRALTAFAEVEIGIDLRVTAPSIDPHFIWQLVESLDGVGRMLPTPHGTRLLERAAQLWWQFVDYEHADAAYRAAQNGAAPEVRSCLDARLDAVPDAWLTLDPLEVIHPRRVELSWEPPNTAVRAFVVYRSTTASELGVAVERLPADAHTWTDTGTAPDRTYWYRVVAELPDGVLQSNPSPAATPPLTLGIVRVAVSTLDEYLHVFGRLRNGFPQVIRLAPDGSVFERRDGVFIGFGDYAPYDPGIPHAHHVDEVWLTDHGGLGVLSFRGTPGRLPADLMSAVRQGGGHIMDYPRQARLTVVSLDEAENAAWIARGGDSDRAWTSIDCVGPLAICWLSREGQVSLRDQTGQFVTTVELPGAGLDNRVRRVHADPRDGSAWVWFGSDRLRHVDRDGAMLADLTTGAGYSFDMTADLDHDRAIWFTRLRPDRRTELVRIDVDDPDLRQDVVFVDVPRFLKMVPDLNGGVWLITGNEALRIDRSGSTLVRASLDGPSRP